MHDAACRLRGPGLGGSRPGCALRKPQPSSPFTPLQTGGAKLPKVGLCGSQGLSPPPGGGVLELHLGSPRRGASSSLGDLKRLGWVLLPTGSQTPTLRGSVCFKSQTPPKKIIKKSQTPKPQGGGSGRSWSPPPPPQGEGDPVYKAKHAWCLCHGEHTHPPLSGSPVQALATRGSIFLSYGLHVSWAPWGDLWGTQTSAEQTRSQTAFLSHSGSRQAAKWRETVWGVTLLPLGTPPAPGPTAALSLLVHLSPTPP